MSTPEQPNTGRASPVRACCGQRHWTTECPDGLVMCCLCFRRVQVADLNVVGGHPENVCRPCAAVPSSTEENA